MRCARRGSEPVAYAGTCWRWGGPADSREHRHKASDLRREFAKAEYEANEVILSRTHGRRNVDVRGPNAKVAIDPFEKHSLIVLDRAHIAYRVTWGDV